MRTPFVVLALTAAALGPAAQKVQFEDGTWGNPPSTAMDELIRATRGIEPLPASKLVLPTAATPVEVVSAARPVAPPDDGLPPVAWVFLAAGALGLLALLARGAAGMLGRRGGSATAG